ncbi:MAG: hypothetical protein IJP23_06000 [Oscillospiraceae bacterium]|nr:hypothetical protein [Oscillospiraceae bacterium]
MAKYISEYDADRASGEPLDEQYTLDEIMLEFSENAPLVETSPDPVISVSRDEMPPEEMPPAKPIENQQAINMDDTMPLEPVENSSLVLRARRRSRRAPAPEMPEEPAPQAPEEKPGVDDTRSMDDGESPTIAMNPIQVEEPAKDEETLGRTPQKAMKYYAKRLHGLRLRVFVTIILCLIMGYITVAGEYGLFLPAPIGANGIIRVWVTLVLQVLCGIIALDILVKGVRELIKLKIHLNTMAFVAYFSSLVHSVMYLTGFAQWGFPMGAVVCWGMLFLLLAELQRCRGRHLSCKAASAATDPAFVVKCTGIWQESTLSKTSGDGRDFVAQLEANDGAHKAWALISPIFIIVSIVLSVLICVAEGEFSSVFRHLSALTCAGLSLGAAMAFTSPFKKLSRRLSGRAAALAGWRGSKLVSGKESVIITDEDIFPAGSASLNGMKVVGGSSADKVLSYTASVVAASGSCLGRSFTELLNNQGIPFSQVKELSFDEEGLSARISGNYVFVGTRNYMESRSVVFSEEIKLENAIYTAINGELAGIFAVKYGSGKAAGEAMDLILSDRKLHAVLAVRNFHLEPEYLAKKLDIPEESMEYPKLSDRLGLSEKGPVDGKVAAALSRQGLLPFIETVVGGRRLRKAVKWNVALSAIGAAVGILIMFYLAMIGEFSAGSAANLLIYNILWAVPTALISGWVNRY